MGVLCGIITDLGAFGGLGTQCTPNWQRWYLDSKATKNSPSAFDHLPVYAHCYVSQGLYSIISNLWRVSDSHISGADREIFPLSQHVCTISSPGGLGPRSRSGQDEAWVRASWTWKCYSLDICCLWESSEAPTHSPQMAGSAGLHPEIPALPWTLHFCHQVQQP